jgi:ubiquinone/menaquinone biosynthesis C-methylase UbiE
MVQQHAPETMWSLAQLAIAPTDHVLEIGFGAGRALTLAADRAASGHVSGLDLSPTMVHVARRRNTRLIQAGRIRLLRGSVTALPFADQQFDGEGARPLHYQRPNGRIRSVRP